MIISKLNTQSSMGSLYCYFFIDAIISFDDTTNIYSNLLAMSYSILDIELYRTFKNIFATKSNTKILKESSLHFSQCYLQSLSVSKKH